MDEIKYLLYKKTSENVKLFYKLNWEKSSAYINGR
jgi:hypothetical protein